MLRENPQHRPNIYQAIAEVCSMRHRSIPIKDVGSIHKFATHILRHARSTQVAHNLKPDGISSYRPLSPRSLHRPPL
jgi:hypothetical protein